MLVFWRLPLILHGCSHLIGRSQALSPCCSRTMPTRSRTRTSSWMPCRARRRRSLTWRCSRCTTHGRGGRPVRGGSPPAAAMLNQYWGGIGQVDGEIVFRPSVDQVGDSWDLFRVDSCNIGLSWRTIQTLMSKESHRSDACFSENIHCKSNIATLW